MCATEPLPTPISKDKPFGSSMQPRLSTTSGVSPRNTTYKLPEWPEKGREALAGIWKDEFAPWGTTKKQKDGAEVQNEDHPISPTYLTTQETSKARSLNSSLTPSALPEQEIFRTRSLYSSLSSSNYQAQDAPKARSLNSSLWLSDLSVSEDDQVLEHSNSPVILPSSPEAANGRPFLSVSIPEHGSYGLNISFSPSSPKAPSSVASSRDLTQSIKERTSQELSIHPAFRSDKSFLQDRLDSAISPRTSPPQVNGAATFGMPRSGSALSGGLSPRHLRNGVSDTNRSSTISSSVEENSDNISFYSRQSSLTSAEEEEQLAKEAIDGIDWTIITTSRRTASDFSILSPVKAGVFEDPSSLPVVAEAPNPSPSPTLSEVVNDLRIHLGPLPERQMSVQEDSPPASAPLTPVLEDAPTVPRKSRKRDWKSPQSAIPDHSVHSRRLSAPVQSSVDGEYLAPSMRDLERPFSAFSRPQNPARTSSSDSRPSGSILTAMTDYNESPDTVIHPSASSPADAQSVLLRIMSHLASLKDLQAIAMINKGMFGVYKTNEMYLLRTIMWNVSPAAWELREWSPMQFPDVDNVGSSNIDHMPLTYLHGAHLSKAVIRDLKAMMVARCDGFLRPETIVALSSNDDVNSKRFDDAFYRIWCFCKIFGCEKDREDDITGQLDWLRGGLLAHQQECAATVNINLEFDMTSVLLNAPDHFAQGNMGGLTAGELYDMTEIWNCLAVLLGGYEGRIAQARSHGIFSKSCIAAGDVEAEEATMLEWIMYILTLGPSVVLELAKYSDDDIDKGLKVAKLNGWTDWSTTSSGTSRAAFLREPVARLYEERSMTAALPPSIARNEKEMNRKRVASMAAEIKLARCSSTYRPNERAVSTKGHKRQDSAMAPRRSGVWTQSNVSSIMEEPMPNFDAMRLGNLEGVAEDTSDRAIAKIVALGFSNAQAKQALKLTDMGDGLRVDRAIELLYRQQ